MLEILFARSVQQQAFGSLVVCGFCLGIMTHLAEMLRRVGRIWGAAGDLACCAALLGMLLLVLLHYGDGTRAYGLLGLVIGALLYYAGLSRLVDGCAGLAARCIRQVKKHMYRKKDFPAKTGK